jgi:hypothetical protein
MVLSACRKATSTPSRVHVLVLLTNVGVINRCFTCHHDRNYLSQELLLSSERQAPSIVSMSEFHAHISPTSHTRLSTMRVPAPTTASTSVSSCSRWSGICFDAYPRISYATMVVSCVTNAPSKAVKCVGPTWPYRETCMSGVGNGYT